MYLFSDPSDPLGRYVDSWTPEAGVTSYGGYVNEHFQDEAINCTIKWAPGQPTAGIYAKRDIRLNEELFTGYGKPQWIYTLRFFANILSPRTIQDAITRYHILPTDQLAPCLANQPNQPVLSPPQPHMPATPTPNRTQAHESAPPMDDPSPTSTTSPEIADTTTPIGASPQQLTFPHGTQEGVATTPSQMTAAGQGLYGIRPHPDATHLFAKKGQFICIYATQQHQITATQARSSQSRYMWSTNATNRPNRKALYFDAATALHYGKYLNDMWNAHGNNCELKWNPATGKVEVYALRDILLNEELGTDYGAPFWYQAHNGLTTREQAQQIKAHYRRATLPWFAKQRGTPGPPPIATPEPSPVTSTEQPTQAASTTIIDLCQPSTPPLDLNLQETFHIQQYLRTCPPQWTLLGPPPQPQPSAPSRNSPTEHVRNEDMSIVPLVSTAQYAPDKASAKGTAYNTHKCTDSVQGASYLET